MAEALWVTAYGMGLVFVALCLVMVSTVAVERVFRDRETTGKDKTAALAAPDELELVVALTAAALAWDSEQERGMTAILPPPGAITLGEASMGWKASGRMRSSR